MTAAAKLVRGLAKLFMAEDGGSRRRMEVVGGEGRRGLGELTGGDWIWWTKEAKAAGRGQQSRWSLRDDDEVVARAGVTVARSTGTQAKSRAAGWCDVELGLCCFATAAWAREVADGRRRYKRLVASAVSSGREVIIVGAVTVATDWSYRRKKTKMQQPCVGRPVVVGVGGVDARVMGRALLRQAVRRGGSG